MEQNELGKRYIEYLTPLNIHLLRSLARAVGVSNPTKGLKDELIDRIVSVLLGGTQPVVPSGRGAPIREEPIDRKYLDDLNEIRDRFDRENQSLAEQFDALATPINRMEVRSEESDFFARLAESDREREKNKRIGLLEVLPSGDGKLWNTDYTATEEELIVPFAIREGYDLKFGDMISGEFMPNESGRIEMTKLYAVNNLIDRPKIDRIPFDEFAPVEKKRVLLFLKGEDGGRGKPIYCGQRILLSDSERVSLDTAMDVFSGLPYGTERIVFAFLSFHASSGDVDRLKKRFRSSETALVGTAMKSERLRIAKLFSERVARLAERGDNVVVFVDSLDSLIRLNNEGQTGRMLECGLSANAFSSVKRRLAWARDAYPNGSLTVFGGVRRGDDLADRLIFEEMEDMADCHIPLSSLK